MRNELSMYLLIAVIIIVAIMVHMVNNGKKSIYQAALYLVTVAEETFGSKTGKIKFAQVITGIKKSFPVVSLFIKQKDLELIIENALAEMKGIFIKAKEECSKSDKDTSEDEEETDTE